MAKTDPLLPPVDVRSASLARESAALDRDGAAGSESAGLSLSTGGRVAAYTGVALLMLAFLLPLFWMLLTAFKPIEQVMAVEPSLVPKAHYTEIDGERMRVVVASEPVGRPSVLVTYVTGGTNWHTALLSARAVVDGHAEVVVTAEGVTETRRVPVTVLKQVEADHVRVTEKLYGTVTRSPRMDWVSPDRIETLTRWEARNFADALRAIPFLLYLKNTFVICVLSVLGTVFASAMVAYGFSRIHWPGRDVLFLVTLATMMIPFTVTVIPLYGVYKGLGWIGTNYPLWVPYYFGTAFNIFLLRQFFLTIPKDLTDAARIDGCSHWQIFTRIILPLSRPALGVVALFQFLYAWNDFMGPLIFLTDQSTYTLALGLQFFQSRAGGTDWHLLMAASLLFMLPVVILFFVAHRTFIRGIATTGMK